MKNQLWAPVAALYFFSGLLVAQNYTVTQNINSVPAILGGWAVGSNVTITANSTVTLAPSGGGTVIHPSEGLPVYFSVQSGNATVSGNNTIQLGNEIGVVTLIAYQPGGNITVTGEGAGTYTVPASSNNSTALIYVGPAEGTNTNTIFKITNNSTVDPSQVYISFMGEIPATTPAQTYGNGTAFASNNSTSSITSYSLSDLTGNITINGNATSAYTFSMNSYSGGRIFISYGQPITAAPEASFNTPYGVWEMTIQGQTSNSTALPPPTISYSQNPLNYSPASNFDVSYVDGVSIPMRTIVRNADGSVQQTSTTNPVWTNNSILEAIKAVVPQDALVMGQGNLTINGTSVDMSTRVVRVISPSFPVSSGGNFTALYHTWSTLLGNLTTSNATLNVASYTSNATNETLASYKLSNVLFGYAGGGSGNYTYQAQNMLNEQGYTYTANFTTNLNPSGANPNLASVGIGNGTAGVHLSGNLTSVGPPTCAAFDIYITSDQMSQPQGIYGSNPKYVVYLTATSTNSTVSQGNSTWYETGGIQNDLSGRIVGDLMAGIVFGWAGSTQSIANHASATGLNTANVTLSSDTVGQIQTGELFYLLSLAAAQTSSGNNTMLQQWVGAGLQPGNPDYYDIFSYNVFGQSVAYGTAFGDRFQGMYSPDTTWYTSFPPPNGGAFWPTVGYAEIELLPVSFPAASPSATITASGNFTAFSTTQGTASAAQAFTAGGSSLTGNITVGAPTSFEVSSDGSTFASSLNIPFGNGTVSPTSLSVRLAASAAAGSPSEPISLTSPGATPVYLSVNGTVTPTSTPYTTWLTNYPGLTGNSTAGSADPDGDGFTNDAEFAFDGNPSVPTDALSQIVASGGNMTISFVARNTSPAGASYQVQSTTDLVAGFTDDSSVDVTRSTDQSGILIPPDYERREFTVQLPAEKKFYRIRATLVP